MAIVQSIQNISFGVKFYNLQRILIIEAQYTQFEKEIETSTDEAFIRSAFRIEYRQITTTTSYCGHRCLDKKACKHPCCNTPKVQEKVSLKCKMRDNTEKSFDIFLENNLQKKVDMFELSNIEFWSEDTTWIAHTTPKQVKEKRVSKEVGKEKIRKTFHRDTHNLSGSESESDSTEESDSD